jgi:chromosome segregation ATPase
MDDDSVKQVLRALSKVQDHLARLPELSRELSDVAAKLAPVLQAQADEIAKLDRQIAEKQETDAFKLSEKLAGLQKQVAAAQERHAALEASERSLQGRLNDIRATVEKASEGFKLRAAEA